MQRIFNTLNIYFKKVNNKNIVYIESNNNIDIEINKYVEVNINRDKINFFYIINKNIILYSRRLF